MKKVLKSQIHLITHKVGFIMAFTIMMMFVIVNYALNIKQYFGIELADMLSFLEISTLCENKEISWVLIQCFPFLVVIPAGFSLATDKAVREDILWISRCGRKKYMLSKTLAVFITTFICFALPFLIELLLNVVTFPMEAHGNLFGAELYSDNYFIIKRYYMFQLYFKYPVLYALIEIAFFGAVSGMLAVVTTAVSAYFHKYRAYLLLPVYLILTGIGMLKSITGEFPYETSYEFYLNWCTEQIDMNDFIWFVCVIFIVFMMAAVATAISARKDTL